MPITDYSTSAASNTVLGTIPVGPGMERNKVNDAIQQLMADIAAIPDDNGSDLIGFLQAGTGAVARTVEAKIKDLVVSVNDFYDAADGVNADTLALTRALATGKTTSFRGTLTLTSSVTMPTGAKLIGEGYSSDNGTRGESCIVRNFTGSDPTILVQADCLIQNIDIDNDNKGTGNCITVTGERAVLRDVSARKSGGDGIRIGNSSPSMNANLWRAYNVLTLHNANDGFRVDHDSTNPLPDVNAGVLVGLDSRNNGRDGLNIGEAIDNSFYGVCCQNSLRHNVYLGAAAQGNRLYSPYTESSSSAELLLDTGSTRNMVFGNRSNTAASGWTDNGTENLVIQTRTSTAGWNFGAKMTVFNAAGSASFDMYAGANEILAAQIQGRDAGVGTRGKGVAMAKRNGNTPIDIFEWDETGVNLLSVPLKYAGTQVVGARGAAVADATGGATVDTEARTAINTLLARLRAHGLIAP